MNSLSPDQITRLEYLVNDSWVVDTGEADDQAQSWANFTRVLGEMSTIELHHFACNFNWDCGVKELTAVVEHPSCDAGTALMIYWLGRPADHYRLERQNKRGSTGRDFSELLRKIEAKLQAGEFRCRQISCDPTNILGQPMTRGSDRDREVVPAAMFEKINGIEVEPHRW